MFPIVPYCFAGNRLRPVPQPVDFVTDSSKLLVAGRVCCAQNQVIRQGAVTHPVDIEKVLGQIAVVQLSVQTSSSTPHGFIELNLRSEDIWANDQIHWLRAIRLSDDCHSYNVRLRFQSGDDSTTKLVLQAVKTIEAGEELLMWFSEDILATLQIPFLTPANIQGQKKYVCSACSALYESPNPLKLHISLGCGRQSIPQLWQRLLNTTTIGTTCIRKNNEKPFALHLTDFKRSVISPHFEESVPKLASPLTTSPPPPQTVPTTNGTAIDLSQHHLYRPYQSLVSAFRPFRNHPDDHPNQNQSYNMMNDNNVVVVPPLWFYQQQQQQQQQSQVQSSIANQLSPVIDVGGDIDSGGCGEDEAKIETMVSNMGKSRRGHVCLYCGKCYSRKYGLKIHIRTHTGYKPLKCKYCLRPFGDPSNLNKHVRLHDEGQTPYKCDLCGKVLVRRRDLDRHLKSRHIIEMHPDLNIIRDDDDSNQQNECKTPKSDSETLNE